MPPALRFKTSLVCIRFMEHWSEWFAPQKGFAMTGVSSSVARLVAWAILITAVTCSWDLGAAAEVPSAPPSFAGLAESVKPAVVNISTVSIFKIPGNPVQFFFGNASHNQKGPFDEYLRDFFGDVPERELMQKSQGSGFIVDKTGYIITNYHVVQQADEIAVRMTDGREFKAIVMGKDAKTDLSLIKIPWAGQDLPALRLGNSDEMRVGDWVVAVGNPFGLAHTVTQGIISAKGRVIGTGPYDDFLQTDAPINPGNSGGPLVNLKGEAVGIATAIMSTGQVIGFAIPSNIVKNVVAQLRERGKVVRGWIGVSVQEVNPDMARSFKLKKARGALIGDITKGGPTDTAGARRGDVVLTFEGKQVLTAAELSTTVVWAAVGSTASMTILRGGKEMTLTLKIAELSED